jgi:hypothetical protein
MPDRDETIKTIKQALKQRTGRQWSVTGGRGTAYGWIEIRAIKKYAANEWGDLTDDDQAYLAQLLGLDRKAHRQGVSIPASSNYYSEYIARAKGETPEVYGEPYWD